MKLLVDKLEAEESRCDHRKHGTRGGNISVEKSLEGEHSVEVQLMNSVGFLLFILCS